jgi:hypothetical protein
MIKSEVSEQYLLEEDAVEGFRQAVNNGQIRLALQILVDIIDVFEGFIASVVEDDEEEVPAATVEIESVKGVQEEKVEEEKVEQTEEKEVVQEKKTTTKKPSAKDQEPANAAE